MKSNNLKTATLLLQDFLQTFEKRKVESLFYAGDFFDHLLMWHYDLHAQQNKYLRQDKNIEIWIQYDGLFRTINNFILAIFKGVLTDERSYLGFPFFDKLNKHYQTTKHNFNYWKYFISSTGKTLFENIADAPDHYNIWEHYFPTEWKVTRKNLENRKDSPAALLWFAEFISWAQNRIRENSKEPDMQMDEIVRELFPETDPVLFSHFLIFAFSALGEGRIKFTVEKNWNFGYAGRVYTSWSPDTMEQDYARYQEEMIKYTVDFIKYINNTVIRTYTPEQINQFIVELESLKDQYPKDSRQEHNRLSLLELLNELKVGNPNSDISPSNIK